MRGLLAALPLIIAINAAVAEQQGCNGYSRETPAGLSLVCSATWQLNAKCTGIDLWDKWTITGRTQPKGAMIGAWEKRPVTVLGYEMLKIHNDTSDQRTLNHSSSWFMVGSALVAQPDAVLWLGPGETRASRIWPHGHGQIWGANDTIDVHGTCWGDGGITLMLTVYYSPSPLGQPPLSEPRPDQEHESD